MALTLPLLELAAREGSRDHVSWSSLSTYRSCPLKYHFRYVAHREDEFIPSSLLFGQCIHASLESYFRALLSGRPAPDLDGMLGAFWDAWHERAVTEVQFPKTETLDSIAQAVERVLATFLTSAVALPEGVIVGVEEEVRAALVPGMPEFVARLDLVIDTGESLLIRDFKTSRTHWDEAQALASGEQLLLYGELAKPMAEGRPVRMEFAVLTRTKVPTLEQFPVRLDRGPLERTRMVLHRLWQAIRAGHFYPSPSPMQCPSCPYQKACRKWEG